MCSGHGKEPERAQRAHPSLGRLLCLCHTYLCHEGRRSARPTLGLAAPLAGASNPFSSEPLDDNLECRDRHLQEPPQELRKLVRGTLRQPALLVKCPEKDEVLPPVPPTIAVLLLGQHAPEGTVVVDAARGGETQAVNAPLAVVWISGQLAEHDSLVLAMSRDAVVGESPAKNSVIDLHTGVLELRQVAPVATRQDEVEVRDTERQSIQVHGYPVLTARRRALVAAVPDRSADGPAQRDDLPGRLSVVDGMILDARSEVDDL
mmetsp:Transcript_50154/g.126424  ORF Transcript_50154/g.126424 Transcript_50154/m.126424 type:complete len:262 (+) Transcript_50154:29-814(+)